MKNHHNESEGEIKDETLTPGAADVKPWLCVCPSGEPSVTPLPPAVWALGREGFAGVRSLQALRDHGTRLLTALPCVLDRPSQDPIQLETSRWVSQAVSLSCGRLCSQPWGQAGAGRKWL